MGVVPRLRDPAVPVRPLLHACRPEKAATCSDVSHTGGSLPLGCLRVGPRRTKRPAIPGVDRTAPTTQPPRLYFRQALLPIGSVLALVFWTLLPWSWTATQPAVRAV